MGHYEARDDDIIYVPFDDVQGEKKNVDGSMRFKLLGGKYHDMVLRVYPPYDTMWFPDGETYELTPPVNMKKSKKWKYVFNPTLLFGIPCADRGA